MRLGLAAALLLMVVAATCLGVASAFLGATPLRTGAAAATTKKAANPFQRRSLVLQPTLIINHSAEAPLEKPEKEALILEASKIVAKTLGKPESYVMCSLTEATMSFGGKIGVRCVRSITGVDSRCGPGRGSGDMHAW